MKKGCTIIIILLYSWLYANDEVVIIRGTYDKARINELISNLIPALKYRMKHYYRDRSIITYHDQTKIASVPDMPDNLITDMTATITPSGYIRNAEVLLKPKNIKELTTDIEALFNRVCVDKYNGDTTIFQARLLDSRDNECNKYLSLCKPATAEMIRCGTKHVVDDLYNTVLVDSQNVASITNARWFCHEDTLAKCISNSGIIQGYILDNVHDLSKLTFEEWYASSNGPFPIIKYIDIGNCK